MSWLVAWGVTNRIQIQLVTCPKHVHLQIGKKQKIAPMAKLNQICRFILEFVLIW